MYSVGDSRPQARPDWSRIKMNIADSSTVIFDPLAIKSGDLRNLILKNFLRPPSGYEDKPKTTLITVVESFLHRWPDEIDYLCLMLNSNIGMREVAVCNLILFSATDFHKTKKFLYESNLVKISLDRWLDVKDEFSKIRQTGWLTEDWYDWDYALLTRRLLSLVGRNNEEADWDEQRNTFNNPARKPRRMFTGQRWSAKAYNEARFKSLTEIADRVAKTMERKDDELISWWKRRWYNTPSGSSSISKEVVREKYAELQLKQFEVDKKIAAEVYSEEDLMKWLTEDSYILARCSTKHENGYKNRALQAGNDENSFITSYASDGVEHNYKAKGVVISQKPKDVAEWLGLQLCNKRRWHVSYDYDAWNTQVDNRDQAFLNYSVAEKLADRYPGDKWASDKAACNFWVAQSNNRQFLKVKDETYRTYWGLYSGSRNTARDNSLIHEMYQDVILQSLTNMTGSHYDVAKKSRKSGDDETMILGSKLECALYVRIVEETGYVGKRAKLMIAEGNSEFLQLSLNSEGKPVYPVAPVIATFSSGNWYKQPVRDLPAVVPALCDQLWNMVREGCDYTFCREILARTADWFMQVPIAEGRHLVDWKAYKWFKDVAHPMLPECNTGLDIPNITIENFYNVHDTKATTDSIESELKWWKMFDFKYAEEERKERSLKSFQKSIRKELDGQYCEEARRVFKERLSNTVLEIFPLVKVEKEPLHLTLQKKMAGGSGERNPPSFDEICVRYKIPPMLASRLVGTPDFAKFDAKIRSELKAANKNKNVTKRYNEYWLPPPLIAVR